MTAGLQPCEITPRRGFAGYPARQRRFHDRPLNPDVAGVGCRPPIHRFVQLHNRSCSSTRLPSSITSGCARMRCSCNTRISGGRRRYIPSFMLNEAV